MAFLKLLNFSPGFFVLEYCANEEENYTRQ